mgnify:FL=1
MINKYLQEQHLLKGIIRIQSIGRGYLVRKQYFGMCTSLVRGCTPPDRNLPRTEQHRLY